MGIDLQARSVSDSKKIHNGGLCTGGFNVDLIFTNLSATSETIRGLYNDIGLSVDADTGMVISGGSILISFHQDDLTIWDGKADIQRWKIAFTNGAGQSIVAEISNVMPDRSFGDVMVKCKIVSGHR